MQLMATGSHGWAPAAKREKMQRATVPPAAMSSLPITLHVRGDALVGLPDDAAEKHANSDEKGEQVPAGEG